MSSLITTLFVAACPTQGDATRRVSSREDGTPPPVAAGLYAAVSADGRYCAFVHSDDDLVAGVAPFYDNIFVWERATGVLSCASLASDGAPADANCRYPAFSGDGRYVAFASAARNLDGWNSNYDSTYVVDRETGAAFLASPSADGWGLDGGTRRPKLSADGSRIAFYSDARNLVDPPLPSFEPHAYVFDVTTGVVTLASVAPDGTRWRLDGYDVFLSADGNFVVFDGNALPWTATKNFRKDLATGELLELSLTNDGAPMYYPAAMRGVTAGGSLVLFETLEALVPEDTNGVLDVYVRDLVGAVTERVSLGVGGIELIYESGDSLISSDGRYVWFRHIGGEIVESDSGSGSDLFVHDRWFGTISQLTRGTLDEQANEDVSVGTGYASDDASLVAFNSNTTDFTSDDTSFREDVYVRERAMTDAAATHYGAGWPGRNGVPTITQREDPIRGKTWIADISCSAGAYSVAFLLIGVQSTQIPTRLGGDLLVETLMTVPIGLSPSGGTFLAWIPDEWEVLGYRAYLQALELDPWASKGVSFTDGIEVLIGDR